MSNKTTTTTTTNANLDALLNNATFVQMSRINEISNLQNDIETDENLNFERTLRISEHFKIALSFFATDEAKEMAKECNTKLTNENLSIMFKYSLAQFNRYKAVSKLESEIIKNYKEQTPKNRGLDSLIKFANKPTNEDTSEDKSEESEESANEVEVKNDVNIKVDRKKNKLVWKGVATLDILDMIILEAQRQKAELLKLAEKK